MDAIATENFESPATQLSPTLSYYLRKLLREQVAASSLDPTTDLTTLLSQTYGDPQDFAAACRDLERLVRYHQALSSQGALHPSELEKTEREILRILTSPRVTALLPMGEMVIVRIAEPLPETDALQLLLRQRGYQFTLLRPGRNTLALAKQVEPDVILMNLNLPERGFELAQAMLRDRQLQRVPILMVSDLYSVSDKIKALKLGITDYIAQPCPPEEIAARLDNQLQFQRYRKKLEQDNRELRFELQTQASNPANSQATLLAQEVINRSSDYVLFIDRSNHIVHGNPAACELLGFPAAELIGRSIEQLDDRLAPEDWQTIWGHLQQHASLNLKSSHHTAAGQPLEVNLEFKYITLHGQEYSCILATQS
jgi:PAS domain S-box-containing protein